MEQDNRSKVPTSSTLARDLGHPPTYPQASHESEGIQHSDESIRYERLPSIRIRRFSTLQSPVVGTNLSSTIPNTAEKTLSSISETQVEDIPPGSKTTTPAQETIPREVSNVASSRNNSAEKNQDEYDSGLIDILDVIGVH